MNRKDFIDALRKEISKLPVEEIDAAVEYYEEYFDEAGKENEQEVLEQLGSPKKVAGQIKSEYAVRLFEEDEKPTVKKRISAVWYVVMGICSAPVAIPLAATLGVVVFTVFITVICCIIALFAGIIGCIAGAVASIVIGILAVPVTLSSAVLLIGFGLAGLGIMAIMGMLLALGVRSGTNAVVRAARRRNERRRIEKMARINENKKWRYKEDVSEERGEMNE